MNGKTTVPKHKQKPPLSPAEIPEFVPKHKNESKKCEPSKKRCVDIPHPSLPFFVAKSQSPKKAPKQPADLKWLGNPFTLQDGWAWKLGAFVVGPIAIVLIAAYIQAGAWPPWKNDRPTETETTITEATTSAIPEISVLDFNFVNAKTVFAPQDEHQIQVMFEPISSIIDASHLLWHSDDPIIVEVSGIGLLTAHNPGTTTISAIYKGLKKTITITVRKPVKLTKMYFSEKARFVPISGTLTLDVLFEPKDATNKDFIVESNNPTAIEAKKEGSQVVITVLKNDGQTYHARIKICSIEKPDLKDSIEVFADTIKGGSIDVS